MSDLTYTMRHDGERLEVRLGGHLDINTTPELDDALDDKLDGISELCLDLERVTYVSSMGLRLLLSLQKRMFKQGSMTVANVSGDVKKLFDDTGFSEIMTLV